MTATRADKNAILYIAVVVLLADCSIRDEDSYIFLFKNVGCCIQIGVSGKQYILDMKFDS